MNSRHTLVIKNLTFYSSRDIKCLFKHLSIINCIDDITADKESLYVHINAKTIHKQDLADLIGVFKRYSTESIAQLQTLCPDNDIEWLKNEKIMHTNL